MSQPISFTYRNHRGEVEHRRVTLDSIEFIYNPGYDYQPGWFLSGWDHDKEARRSFALSNIVLPTDALQEGRVRTVSFALGPRGRGPNP